MRILGYDAALGKLDNFGPLHQFIVLNEFVVFALCLLIRDMNNRAVVDVNVLDNTLLISKNTFLDDAIIVANSNTHIRDNRLTICLKIFYVFLLDKDTINEELHAVAFAARRIIFYNRNVVFVSRGINFSTLEEHVVIIFPVIELNDQPEGTFFYIIDTNDALILVNRIIAVIRTKWVRIARLQCNTVYAYERSQRLMLQFDNTFAVSVQLLYNAMFLMSGMHGRDFHIGRVIREGDKTAWCIHLIAGVIKSNAFYEESCLSLIAIDIITCRFVVAVRMRHCAVAAIPVELIGDRNNEIILIDDMLVQIDLTNERFVVAGFVETCRCKELAVWIAFLKSIKLGIGRRYVNLPAFLVDYEDTLRDLGKMIWVDVYECRLFSAQISVWIFNRDVIWRFISVIEFSIYIDTIEQDIWYEILAFAFQTDIVDIRHILDKARRESVLEIVDNGLSAVLDMLIQFV